MSNNEINIKINVSDDLVNKFVTIMLAATSPMPMIAGVMPPQLTESKSEKPPMGFANKSKSKSK